MGIQSLTMRSALALQCLLLFNGHCEKMRIGIDGRPFLGARTGIGRYVYELCRCLDDLLPEATFFVYSNCAVELPVSSHRWKLVQDAHPLAKYMKTVIWLKLRCGTLCDADNLDVFWGNSTFLPSLPKKTRTVITVYDLVHQIAPESMPFLRRWAYKLFFGDAVKRADCITTISQGTSDRLFQQFGRRANAIISPAIDSQFKPKTMAEIKTCLDQYAIPTPYILSVATREPRKNLDLLIKAFLDLKRSGQIAHHKLVLVGGMGWKDKRLTSLIGNTLGNDVIALGYMPDEVLPAIYSGADLFVFPSKYEGFGMPVLEARGCGTTVVTSDIPELREAGGEDAIYIQPTLDGICQGILAGLSQEKRSQSLKDPLPSWEVSARCLAQTFVKTQEMI